jgi:hypothetical protein
MAQAGFTPIITYHSTTGSAVPSNANLSPGELALNIADMKLYCENSSGVVTLLADAAAQGTVTSVDVSGGTTGLTTSGGPVTGSGTITLAGTLAVANGGTGITSFGTGVATWLGTPSSSNLAAAVTDETGSGALVFGTTPTLTGYREAYSAVTSSSNTATLDFSAATVFQLTLSEDVSTFTWSNAPSSGTAFGFTLRVIQDSTARTITWPAAVDWPGASAPILSTGSGDVDVFTFFTTDGGTTYYGFTAGQDLS